jgi:hypothetical protein
VDQPGGHTLIFTILIYLHILHKTLTGQYLGMDDLIVVVSTEGMTKRTISDNDNPWINAPFKDDQVSQTLFTNYQLF